MSETPAGDEAARRLWLALKDPALSCPKCSAMNQKRFGNQCWKCRTALNWKQSLICKKCRRLHARPTAFCIDCRGPLEYLWECSSCQAIVGVSMAFCPECGHRRSDSPSEAAVLEASVRCPACGQSTDAEEFCSHCGAHLVSSQHSP